MKLTYELPNILIDNTKTEAMVELIEQTSASLSDSGSFLVSRGNGEYEIKQVSSITSSLIHDIVGISPIYVEKTDPIRPKVGFEGILPVQNGGTGLNAVQNNKFLFGYANIFKFIEFVDGIGTKVSVIDGNTISINANIATDAVSKNSVFAGPQTGPNIIPTFRFLINEDLPSNLSNKIISQSQFSGSFSGSHRGIFSGVFSGDGSALTGIDIGSFTGRLTVPQGGTGRDSLIFKSLLMGNGSDPVIQFSGSSADFTKCLIWTPSGFGFGDKASLGYNSYSADQIVNGIVSSSDGFYGDGTNITNLSSSQINNFNLDVRNVFSGSGGITINEVIPGTLYELSSSNLGGGLSTVYSYGNITGSGASENPIVLKDNISLTSITASFNGNASGLNSLSGSQFIDFKTDVVSQLSGSGAVTIGLNGVIHVEELLDSQTGISKFTEANEVNVGDIVSIGFLGLTKSDKSDDLLSNAIGVVFYSGSDGVVIQSTGLAVVALGGSYTRGTPLYVGSNGAAIQYSELNVGDYVTQIGFLADPSTNKIFVQPRIFGQR